MLMIQMKTLTLMLLGLQCNLVDDDKTCEMLDCGPRLEHWQRWFATCLHFAVGAVLLNTLSKPSS